MNATVDRVVLDTDVVSTLLRGSLEGAVAAGIAGLIPLVTFVTAGELYRGAAHADWGERRLAALTGWLAQTPIWARERRSALGQRSVTRTASVPSVGA